MFGILCSVLIFLETTFLFCFDFLMAFPDTNINYHQFILRSATFVEKVHLVAPGRISLPLHPKRAPDVVLGRIYVKENKRFSFSFSI